MDIIFKNNKIKKICEDHKKLKNNYGHQAEKIIQRLLEIASAETLHDISILPQTRFHKLSGNCINCFAVDLKHPFRMIGKINNGDGVDLKTVTSITIIEICINYH